MIISKTDQIFPNLQIGGLKIGDSLDEHLDFLKSFAYEEGKTQMQGPFHVEYIYENFASIVFNIINSKLAKVGVYNDFKGTIFDEVRIGMPIKYIIKILPDMYYNDNEESYFIPNFKGISLSFENHYLMPTDNPENKLEEISIFNIDLLYV